MPALGPQEASELDQRRELARAGEVGTQDMRGLEMAS